ncbi:MAG: DsrE/DsrF/DrsH-like family protein [Peptococcaceae bacterium]|jgi:predicted peroxiredoxin|nr:DsrE/DsrF/DrsH-like family protein [Peptococcaceae bacterium]
MKQKSILYVQTSDAPERQYAPLVLAQTAKAMDIYAAVYYLGMGLKVLLPGAAEKIQVGSFPNVMQMITQAQGMGVTFYACEASKQLLALDKVDLIPGVTIVGAGTLNDLTLDADATMWF